MNIKSIFTSVIEHKICKVNSPKRKEADDIIALPQLKSDVFEISQKAKDEILAQKVLDRTRKLGIKEFQTLTNAEISALDAISKEDIKKDAKINAEIGLELKNKLDKEFGKDKYVFVCIGTSPSGIARVMEFSGVETKYIPISHFNAPNCQNEISKKKKPYREYINYLKEIGFNKKVINDKGKKYLFYDYTHTGRTLSNMKVFCEKNLKLPKENLEFRSLNTDIRNIAKERKTKGDFVETAMKYYDYIDIYLEDCAVSKIGGIPHLPYNELEFLYERLKEESDTAKLYNYNLMKILQQENKLRYTKENRNLI